MDLGVLIGEVTLPTKKQLDTLTTTIYNLCNSGMVGNIYYNNDMLDASFPSRKQTFKVESNTKIQKDSDICIFVVESFNYPEFKNDIRVRIINKYKTILVFPDGTKCIY